MTGRNGKFELGFEESIEDLHEFLWGSGFSGTADALQKRLLASLVSLDRRIGAGGALKRAAAPQVTPLVKEGRGGSRYFTLVGTVGCLSIARDALMKGDFAKCAGRSFDAISNLTVAMLSAVGRFDMVAEYDHNGADPKAYMVKAVEALSSRGAKTADRWKRLYLLALVAKETVPKLPDEPSKRLEANAGLALAGVAAARFNGILRETGTLEEVTFGGFPRFAELAALGKR